MFPLLKPMSPAEEERAERERVFKLKPHLSLVGKDRRPDPDMFRWVEVASMFPVRKEER